LEVRLKWQFFEFFELINTKGSKKLLSTLKVTRKTQEITMSEKNKPSYFGLGRRKSSVARVMLVPGTGSLVVNNKPGELYLQFNAQYINDSKAPLRTLGLDTSYDIHVNAHGGGLKGQADAIKLGVARASCYLQNSLDGPENRTLLKPEGFLTRDSRIKERKKYGLRKARKAGQFSKR